MASSWADQRRVQRVEGESGSRMLLPAAPWLTSLGTAAPGEIYTFLELENIFSERGNPPFYKYVKPAYLLIWEHSPPSCERIMSRHHVRAAGGVCHIFLSTKKVAVQYIISEIHADSRFTMQAWLNHFSLHGIAVTMMKMVMLTMGENDIGDREAVPVMPAWKA